MVHEDEASGAADASGIEVPPGARNAGADPTLDDGESRAPAGERHVTRVVVWDTPAAVECGQCFAVRVGVACASRCTLAGRQVEVRDHAGERRATAALDEQRWPGTDALYHAELTLVAPDAEGLYTWEAAIASPGAAPVGAAAPVGVAAPGGATAPGDAAATGDAAAPRDGAATDDATAPHDVAATCDVAAKDQAATPHARGSARFGVRVVSRPEHVLTVVATDAESGSPLEGARVVAHPYRALTDERGVAEMRVPSGEYRLFVSGKGCVPFRFDGEVTTDTTIRAVLAQDRELSDADIWS